MVDVDVNMMRTLATNVILRETGAEMEIAASDSLYFKSSVKY